MPPALCPYCRRQDLLHYKNTSRMSSKPWTRPRRPTPFASLRYDLFKLRTMGLIVKLPNSPRYQLCCGAAPQVSLKAIEVLPRVPAAGKVTATPARSGIRTLKNLSDSGVADRLSARGACAATSWCRPRGPADRSALPHGHVLAVLGTARRLNKLDRLLPRPMDRRNRLARG